MISTFYVHVVSRLVLLCFVDIVCLSFFFFKQKTAYEMRISDWSSDVCSSDLMDIVRADRARVDLDRKIALGRGAEMKLPAQRFHQLADQLGADRKSVV